MHGVGIKQISSRKVKIEIVSIGTVLCTNQKYPKTGH
jgi:hypothetical protein